MFDFQLVQVGPSALRLSVGEGKAALARARATLLAFLGERGLAKVRVSALCGGEHMRGRTGKLQRVVAINRQDILRRTSEEFPCGLH